MDTLFAYLPSNYVIFVKFLFLISFSIFFFGLTLRFSRKFGNEVSKVWQRITHFIELGFSWTIRRRRNLLTTWLQSLSYTLFKRAGQLCYEAYIISKNEAAKLSNQIINRTTSQTNNNLFHSTSKTVKVKNYNVVKINLMDSFILKTLVSP
jgi:hypothetical protein